MIVVLTALLAIRTIFNSLDLVSRSDQRQTLQTESRIARYARILPSSSFPLSIQIDRQNEQVDRQMGERTGR